MVSAGVLGSGALAACVSNSANIVTGPESGPATAAAVATSDWTSKPGGCIRMWLSLMMLVLLPVIGCRLCRCRRIRGRIVV